MGDPSMIRRASFLAAACLALALSSALQAAAPVFTKRPTLGPNTNLRAPMVGMLRFTDFYMRLHAPTKSSGRDSRFSSMRARRSPAAAWLRTR